MFSFKEIRTNNIKFGIGLILIVQSVQKSRGIPVLLGYSVLKITDVSGRY